ncbi:DSN1 protein, partial [Baryphthengus martii]|nr:DSN1 protein [Baryphthengus martii]
KRRSWCRSSLKGTKRRKSLPPFHRDVTELSKSINLDLLETERLAELLLASFQFSAQKLEQSLKQSDGFSPEAFKAHAESVSEDLKRYVQKLKRDGTLKSCVDNPNGPRLFPKLFWGGFEAVLIRSLLRSFSGECQAWDRLLLCHRESAEEMSRQLEELRRPGGRVDPSDLLQASQAEVLRSKPNYQQLLDEEGEVLSGVELGLDELMKTVKLLQTFRQESRHYLQRLSEQLATRTFRQLENSPVRKLIAAPPGPKPPPEG